MCLQSLNSKFYKANMNILLSHIEAGIKGKQNLLEPSWWLFICGGTERGNVGYLPLRNLTDDGRSTSSSLFALQSGQNCTGNLIPYFQKDC